MTPAALWTENVELKYEITEGTELETLLSKGNRNGGSELIWMPLLQNLHSALRAWDQDSMMDWQVQRSWISCKGSIEIEAICGSDHLARQKTIQSLKRALQRNRVWFHISAQVLETEMVPRPLDLALLDSQKAHPFSLHTALQKELKQLIIPIAQMALIIKVALNPDVDVHKQRENSIHSWLNLKTSWSWMMALDSGAFRNPRSVAESFYFWGIHHSIPLCSFISSIKRSSSCRRELAALVVKESESTTGSQTVGWLFFLDDRKLRKD